MKVTVMTLEQFQALTKEQKEAVISTTCAACDTPLTDNCCHCPQCLEHFCDTGCYRFYHELMMDIELYSEDTLKHNDQPQTRTPNKSN